MAKTIKVYEVIYHVSDDHPQAYGGAAGDGSFIERFRRECDAVSFAKGRTYSGRPATVTVFEASRALASRWGVA